MGRGIRLFEGNLYVDWDFSAEGETIRSSYNTRYKLVGGFAVAIILCHYFISILFCMYRSYLDIIENLIKNKIIYNYISTTIDL